MSLLIRDARPADARTIVRLIKALAEYEKLSAEIENDEARVAEAFFGPNPRTFCSIAEMSGEPVGYAIWFYSYSTFTGRHGIYLEDLFVVPEHRGAGIGKAFLRTLAARCRSEGLTRLEWAVLDWNRPAIRFYRSIGAAPLEGWTGYRLAGDALGRLGASVG